jgi:hypothetical protein
VALSRRIVVNFTAKLSTTTKDISGQGLLGGLCFVAGKPEWFWVFVKINTEFYTLTKLMVNHLYFMLSQRQRKHPNFGTEKTV